MTLLPITIKLKLFINIKFVLLLLFEDVRIEFDLVEIEKTDGYINLPQ